MSDIRRKSRSWLTFHNRCSASVQSDQRHQKERAILLPYDMNLRYLKNDHDLAVEDSVKRTRIGVSRRVSAMQPLQPHSISTSRKIDFERTIRRTKKPPTRARALFSSRIRCLSPYRNAGLSIRRAK